MHKCGTDFGILMCPRVFLLADGASWYTHTFSSCVTVTCWHTTRRTQRRALTQMWWCNSLWQFPERVEGQALIEWACCSVCSECVCDGGRGGAAVDHSGTNRTPGSGMLMWARCRGACFILIHTLCVCVCVMRNSPPHTPPDSFSVFFYLNLISTAALVQLQKALIELNLIYLVPN